MQQNANLLEEVLTQKSELLVCWCLCLDCFLCFLIACIFFLSLDCPYIFLDWHWYSEYLSFEPAQLTCISIPFSYEINERLYYSTPNIHVWTHGGKITTWKPSSNDVIKALLFPFSLTSFGLGEWWVSDGWRARNCWVCHIHVDIKEDGVSDGWMYGAGMDFD